MDRVYVARDKYTDPLGNIKQIVETESIPEADIAFDTSSGHDHNGVNSKYIAGGGGSGDMLKSTYDPNEDGVIEPAQLNLSGKSDVGHNHSGVYEPVDVDIQIHINSAHAPSDAQKNSDITKAEIEAKLTGVISSHSHAGGGGEAFPVGSVFLAVVNTNPNSLLGYGTWNQIAQGQFLAGQNSGDADFDTAEEMGGAKTHTHNAHATVDNLRTGGGVSGFATPADAAHSVASHLPPYFVIYIWKRTA